MRPSRTLIVAFAEEEVELTRERASDLADYLWKGLHPGSATSAAKVTDALSVSARRVLRFEPYEVEAIRAALDALRLLPTRD